MAKHSTLNIEIVAYMYPNIAFKNLDMN
jgi:hypothetical protein